MWSLPLLEASRERVLAGDLKSPLKRLLGDADLWLARSRKSDQLFTVTTKPATPSVTYSCSPHCFYSLGTYWWPNNATPDGLPYVRDDGLVNPDTFKYDSIPLSQMLFAVSNLSLAYFFTANRSYAAGAAAFVDTFFFNQETYMDASVGLEHSQACQTTTLGVGPGSSTPRTLRTRSTRRASCRPTIQAGAPNARRSCAAGWDSIGAG